MCLKSFDLVLESFYQSVLHVQLLLKVLEPEENDLKNQINIKILTFFGLQDLNVYQEDTDSGANSPVLK